LDLVFTNRFLDHKSFLKLFCLMSCIFLKLKMKSLIIYLIQLKCYQSQNAHSPEINFTLFWA